jgi:hypothetical protein
VVVKVKDTTRQKSFASSFLYLSHEVKIIVMFSELNLKNCNFNFHMM